MDMKKHGERRRSNINTGNPVKKNNYNNEFYIKNVITITNLTDNKQTVNSFKKKPAAVWAAGCFSI